MGLETVKEEVLGNAKSKADSMQNEARKEAARIMDDAKRKVDLMREKSENEIKKIMESIKRQEVSFAEMENKKTVMESKKEVLQKLFDSVKEKLEEMDEKKKEAILKKLLDKTKKEMEIATIYCSKKDAKFFKGLNVQNTNMIGGFMAENADKTIRIDATFETMLDSIKESEMQIINKTLFV